MRQKRVQKIFLQITMIYIIDSSYLFSLSVDNDSNHQKAYKISKDLSGELIVPSEVFSETINVLWKKVSKDQAVQTATDIIKGGNISFPETTKEIRELAVQKFEKQKKGVSFTDCLVMAFADSFKTKKILGFDEVFRQNGYTV